MTVETRTGGITVRAEPDDSMRRHQAAIPHGYGMAYPDGKGGRVTNGPRINLLTSSEDCDPIAGTPHHKDVPVRLRAATAEESDVAERASQAVRELIAAGSR